MTAKRVAHRLAPIEQDESDLVIAPGGQEENPVAAADVGVSVGPSGLDHIGHGVPAQR